MPHGPREIGKTRQISLPAELLEAVRLEVGDKVYVALADDPPGALLVLPLELVVRWIDRGRSSTAGNESGDVRPEPPLGL